MGYFPPYSHSKNKIEVNYICLIMQQNLTFDTCGMKRC